MDPIVRPNGCGKSARIIASDENRKEVLTMWIERQLVLSGSEEGEFAGRYPFKLPPL
ncbi:hypothetical protein KIN20_002456 [Parelaphostrongylus tenuis]|uniref:Uncharacterized protein n=1 Tax=Parelaphostrongylus tenuis TaxID=148309 RepID=A0AAD5LXT1_PARTN|nr:hypothetical protein KIN20_002456 [Parelaphostrongylus tenuis]